ncbi:hypothetical protein ABKT78_02090 [Enterobacter ludwigii]|uniref:hypothetical protein n=1 Tax=Enterobacter ludwigii TaxID=299767 RepID=UPI002FC1E8CF|nr:hypothetical protein [Enterobacter hormaechei subsp. hoffmannii]MCU3423398.1 hypothetical protein [Enterobacter hormaechei subsp. hoffmannii]MCU3775211.1 hypothetical protein [Enterobacter hormaechei subsp. hoffmannii]
MKVLQTLGAHGKSNHVGIFQYRRFVNGVDIWPSYKIGNRLLARILISHSDWDRLLAHVGSLTKHHYTLTDLKTEICKCLKGVTDFHTNHGPAIAAILEHEGTIDHYGGKSAAINLKPEH